MVAGRGHGKDSRGLGPWGWSAHAPHTSSPYRWTRARRRFGQEVAIVLLLAQSCVPFRHYFWPPEEEEKKAKKGAAVLSGTLVGKGFQGLQGQRRQPLSDQKTLCLKGAGRGLRFEGARGGHRWGSPGHLYTLGAH